MILEPVWRLALAGCLVLFSVGCDSSSSSSGAGGSAGAGGAAMAPPVVPGLWEGEANGIRVCFYVSDDGSRLTSSAECNVTGPSETGSHSFNSQVELIGRDEMGQSCSFDLAYAQDAAIDPITGAFGASDIVSPGDGATLAFSGEIETLRASGVAQSKSGGSTCQVGWEAAPAAPCDEAAVESCLDLLDCCSAILVNPVFFQSCNAVVLQCDQANCLRVLAGYPQCADL